MVKKELAFKYTLGKYRTAKKSAEEITRFARELSKEQIVSQVMEFAHVRSLPTYETKHRLLDRLKAVSDSAIEYRDAIEEESDIDDARNKVAFDSVLEDESVQDIVTVLKGSMSRLSTMGK